MSCCGRGKGELAHARCIARSKDAQVSVSLEAASLLTCIAGPLGVQHEQAALFRACTAAEATDLPNAHGSSELSVLGHDTTRPSYAMYVPSRFTDVQLERVHSLCRLGSYASWALARLPARPLAGFDMQAALELPFVSPSEVTVVSTLASGGFASIFLGRFRTESVALKCVPRLRVADDAGGSFEIRSLIHESYIAGRYKHGCAAAC